MKRLSITLLLCIAMLTNAMAQNPDLNGSWKGALEAGPMSLSIVFHIEQTNDSVIFTWDSPDQKAFDLPAIATIRGNELNVEIAESYASYKGKLENDTLVGIFTQFGTDYPLRMTRNTGNDRPQEAAIEADQNKPYHSENVTFTNGDMTLAGTLTVPNTGSRFPAVVFVHGTGLLDRDENISGHKPFLLMADALSRNGFVVLRYDKRGAGESHTNGPINVETALMADDAMAAVRYLAARPEVDASQVGILGHSEGGIIAFMNAANYPDEVAYIVSMAGVGVSGLELAKKQSRMISYTMGVEPDEEAQSLNDQLLDIIATDTDSLTMRKQLQELIVNNPAQQEAIEKLKAVDPTITEEEINEFAIDRMMSPDTRGLVKYDPTKYLSNIKCPTLAINGTLDCQVACKENLEGIAHLVPHATVRKYEGLNHLFQTCDDWVGSSNYAVIQETMNPQVINDIVTWLQSTVKQ